MQIPRDAVLLRIFIGESDRWHHQPLYEAIVLKARAMHLAGATVLRGPMGFGKSSRLHTSKILRLSMDLPLVIEIVDSEEKIQEFLPVLDPMMGARLARARRARTTAKTPNLDDPNVWQDLTEKKLADQKKKEPEKPRLVVDVFHGDKHVQESFR